MIIYPENYKIAALIKGKLTNSIYRFIKAIAQHVQDRQGNTEVAGRFQTKDIDIKKRLKLPATKNCDYLERK